MHRKKLRLIISIEKSSVNHNEKKGQNRIRNPLSSSMCEGNSHMLLKQIPSEMRSRRVGVDSQLASPQALLLDVRLRSELISVVVREEPRFKNPFVAWTGISVPSFSVTSAVSVGNSPLVSRKCRYLPGVRVGPPLCQRSRCRLRAVGRRSGFKSQATRVTLVFRANAGTLIGTGRNKPNIFYQAGPPILRSIRRLHKYFYYPQSTSSISHLDSSADLIRGQP